MPNLIPGVGQLQEGVERCGQAEEEGVARVAPGKRREEEQDLQVGNIIYIGYRPAPGGRGAASGTVRPAVGGPSCHPCRLQHSV